ncbi:N-acetylglucosamine-6-phosphate deacetylase [Silvanigrella paludirubra]|uniref:N-acetylglucosamine-6-phosphate deacetylase n=1 Tax=Silvanigrella paludirubra TaxID=2499159 RepID=A0A6N6VTY8_9BACT|nr:N-acetylglucosamine-6-phosphate deacetylase [Silvanigrella paludirubra]KAB8039531.1 N-acetylglucosamine-6-phosphate deacetylase [Silvanigrella paludirubra]
MLCLTNACLFDGNSFIKNKNIYIKDGKIIDISSKKNKNNYQEIDVNKNIVCPGFIDIQLNGGGGAFFNDNPSIEHLKKMALAHLTFGTTSFLPTFITDDKNKIPLAISCINKALSQKMSGILGIHLEGPFLNKEKKGIHPSKFIRLPNEADIDNIIKIKEGIVLVTLAPEMVEANFIKRLIENKVIVFAGHTNATYEKMNESFQLGIKGVTHLFNACSPLSSREPGVVGASLLHENSWCGIIADGHHVSFETIKLAFKTKAKNKFILVSDAMSPVGTELESFYINENKIFVKNGKYVDQSGTLAGSAITVYDAFKNLLSKNLVTLEESLQMSSTNAAQCLGIDNEKSLFKKGRVLPHFDADLLILNKQNFNILNIIQNGQLKTFH